MTNCTKCTDYEPSEAQRRLQSYFQDHDYQCTVKEACAACEIGRRTYYDWFSRPAFCRWWQQEAEAWFAKQLPRVQAALLRGATEGSAPGNPTDRKLFLERFDKGFMPKSRVEQSVSGNLAVDLSRMSDEELRRLAHAVDADLAETDSDDAAGGSE